MFKKLVVTALVVGGAVTFVGADVVGRTLARARESVRASLTSSVPLRTQVAEARAQVDHYAENVIRGELAAEALADTLARTEREVKARRAGVARERAQLAALHATLEQRGTSTYAVAGGAAPAPSAEEHAAVRRAREFQAAVVILERREQDLAALKRDHEATLKEVASAKAAQARLAEEVTVLQAEVEALEARTVVAQTRKAADASIDRSGFGDAEARITTIRAAIREQDRRLAYYAQRSEARTAVDAGDPFLGETAVDALKAALEAGLAPAPSTTTTPAD